MWRRRREVVKNIEISDAENVKIEGKDNIIKIDAEDKDVKIKGQDNIINIKEKESEGERRPEPEIRSFEKKEENIKKEVIGFFKKPKVIWSMIALLLLIVLIISINIRTSNLPLLVDSTTGKTIPLALDPYYFLRVAETIIDQGGLPEYDAMRYPALQAEFTHEILPQALVLMYRVANVFGDYTIGFIDVVSPVVFFVLGLIVFFFLAYALTKSKSTAIISSVFLAFIPLPLL